MLSEVPTGWTKARIDAVLQRNTKSISARELAAEGFVAHYSLPAFDANKKPVIEKGSEIKSNKTAIENDCLLFSKLNPRIPRVWRVQHASEQKPVCSTEFWALKSKASKVCLSYAEYFLGWDVFLSHPSIKPASSTNSHQRVDRKAFDAFMLPIPPLEEQKRIAEILISVDASIQATQAVIEQAERVKRGLMEELLTGGLGSEAIARGEVPEGWRRSTLSDLCKVVTGKTPATNEDKYWDGDIPFFSPADLSGTAIVSQAERTITKEALSAGAKLLPKNSILYTCIGSTIGKVAVTDVDCCTNQQINACVAQEGTDYRFLYFQLVMAEPIVKYLSSTTAVPIINKTTFSGIEILTPVVEEQRRIAEKLNSFDVLIAKQKAIIEQQSRVKKGLMDDLLTGKVRTV